MMKKIMALILISVLSFGSAVQVKADDASSTASVTNVIPVASSVEINDSATINLTEDTTTNVIITATVTDNNACGDIDSVAVVLHKSGETASCDSDANNCYITTASVVGSGNTCDSVTDLSADYTTTIAVQYYADPAVWTATVTPSDESAGTADTDTETIATLTALDVTSPIAYGELALSGVTADTTAFDTTVTNTGNNATISVQVKSGAATAMTCTTGTIPVGNEKYHATSTTVYASKTALTAVDATVDSVSAAKTTDGSTGNTDTIGWGLQMPANGVSGSCTGTVVFTAT